MKGMGINPMRPVQPWSGHALNCTCWECVAGLHMFVMQTMIDRWRKAWYENPDKSEDVQTPDKETD